MAHELEMINGEAQLAYAGELPWHGLGVKVPSDLTPEQMMKAAGLDWTVRTEPAYVEIAGKKIKTKTAALVRDSDDRILNMISDDWKCIQLVLLRTARLYGHLLR